MRGMVEKATEGGEEIIHNLRMRLEVTEKERDFYKGGSLRVGGSVGGESATPAARQLGYETPTVAATPPMNRKGFDGFSTIAKKKNVGSTSVKKEARRTWFEMQESSKNHIRVVEGILHRHGESGNNSNNVSYGNNDRQPPVRVTHSLKIAASIVARLYLNSRKDAHNMKRAVFCKWTSVIRETIVDFSHSTPTNLSLLEV